MNKPDSRIRLYAPFSSPSDGREVIHATARDRMMSLVQARTVTARLARHDMPGKAGKLVIMAVGSSRGQLGARMKVGRTCIPFNSAQKVPGTCGTSHV